MPSDMPRVWFEIANRMAHGGDYYSICPTAMCLHSEGVITNSQINAVRARINEERRRQGHNGLWLWPEISPYTKKGTVTRIKWLTEQIKRDSRRGR